MTKLGAQPRRKDHVSAKSRNSAKVNVKSVSDDDSYDEEKIFLKMGTKMIFIFLLFRVKHY